MKIKEAYRALLRVPLLEQKYLSRKLLLLRLLLLGAVCCTLVGMGYRVCATGYQRDLLLARDGMQHLLRAEQFLMVLSRHPLDAYDVAEAREEFTSASSALIPVADDLRFVPGLVAFLPAYGQRLHAALHLVPLALALAQIGEAGCDIWRLLIAKLADPLHAQAVGLSMADLSFIAHRLHGIQTSLVVANSELDQLQPSDMQFDARVSRLVETLRGVLPLSERWLAALENLLPALPVLLGIGAPANYLVEVLDTTELRPGGGFIGNYGVMTLAGGLMVDAPITDTYLLDGPFASSGNGIPFPPAYRWFDIAHGNWGLRDSNLDADFPTAARAAEWHYMREGGDAPLQGVIAITPALIQHLLLITGPIAVPEYQETVNAQNLVELIHEHQLGPLPAGTDNAAAPDGHSSVRKHFTALLAEHFLARMRQVAMSHLSQLLPLLESAVSDRDIQLYFNDSSAELPLRQAHLDGAIQVPPGDDLLVVDANIGINKANDLITSTLTDSITIDTAGNAIHHANLRYAWNRPGQSYGDALYRDYVRIYMPLASVLQGQDGWQQRGSSEAFGHRVWAGLFTLTPGQTRTITLTWLVPRAAAHDASGWHYQELLQKQVGTAWIVHMQVTLPSCAALKHVSGGMRSIGRQEAILDEILSENINISLGYAC